MGKNTTVLRTIIAHTPTMRRLLSITTLLLTGLVARAQQIPQYSQYMMNHYVLNPAVTGMNDFWEVRSNNRLNWIGITDAPRTFIMSAHGPFQKQNMGMGVSIFSDVTGPTSRTGAHLSYAYHLKLTEKLRLGMGLSLGLLQFRIDGTKVTLNQQNDPSFPQAVMSAYTADATFGLNLYHKNFQVGFSAPQLIGNKLEFDNAEGDGSAALARHFMLMGAYTFRVKDFGFMPNLMLKYVHPVPLQFDAGLRIDFREQFWVGAVYRHDDAVSFLAGFLYRDFLLFGYSYDMSTSNLRNYSDGSHEIMVGIRFRPWKKKIAADADAGEHTPIDAGQ
jgi:type IX secretion system PorP/SprF family membrane protein